jgi:lipopolysaccharide transport system ATP-binding protein
MSSETVIQVNNLSKYYEIYEKPQDRLLQMLSRGRRQYYKEFWALRDVSFEVKQGETFGIIGRNGSGKSTLLQILAGTLAQTSGEALVKGRVAALLELGSGFNPEFTGRENVYLNGSVLGLTQQEIDDRYDQILEFADIGEFIDQPVKTYSSGMFVRLAFAVQAHIDANIVIIDEALAVGDIFFRQKCYTRLNDLKEAGAAILLVSHSMPDIEQHCQRALLLNKGESLFIGPSSEATKHYYLLEQRPDQPVSVTVLGNPSSSTEKNRVTEHTILDLPCKGFLDITDKKQVGTGEAVCTSVALLDSQGEPRQNFKQGDKAIFFYEFQLKNNIGVPVCGLTIINDKGIIVYCKNSWQSVEEFSAIEYDEQTFASCFQEVKLDIAPGQYIFHVALAGVSEYAWENRRSISFYEENNYFKNTASVQDIGYFSVGLAIHNGVPFLTHHGLANLPDKIKIAMHR